MREQDGGIDFRPFGDLVTTLGESPIYDERTGGLLLCDIVEHTVIRLGLARGTVDTIEFDSEVGAVGLCGSGRLVVALRRRVVLADFDGGRPETIAEIDTDRPEIRFNDGRVGPDGAFWIGSMDERREKEPNGALYRVSANGRIERKITGLLVSNGVAFSADGSTLFHSDSRGPWIDRWRLDAATGTITERTRIAILDDAAGRPDGGAVDAEGCYWSAGASAGRLNRFAPDGRLVEWHAVPVSAPTMPCFGGADRRTLFVTSMRHNQSAAALERLPLSGRLLVAAAPVAGLPEYRFRDV